jgi:hypothetical protein
MHTDINDLFTGLWQDYLAITPSANKIHSLLKAHNQQAELVNDHIALRTFAIPGIAVNDIAKHFTVLGYVQSGEYDFSSKKLNAWHYQHPDPNQPKVFISELKVNELSTASQAIIHAMVDTMDFNVVKGAGFLYSGTQWQVSEADYRTLLCESEYAAWMAAWGFRANHFTVSVNHLNSLTELSAVNALLKSSGFTLNTAGGEIKGNESVCLAQSSTMADIMPVQFSDNTVTLPSCFYEFAQRFPLPNGQLYQGFVAASADKIFESTNVN